MKTNLEKKLKMKFAGVVLLAVIVGVVSYPKAIGFYPPLYEKLNAVKVNLGLDLQGGIHLEYSADVSAVEDNKKAEAIEAAQNVIERRMNAFGVGELLVQSAYSGGENRIIVEIPGIKDVNEAKNQIKETPFLEFREEKSEADLAETQKMFEPLNEQARKTAQEVLNKVKAGEDFSALAKQHSQDPGSKEDGGDLGFVSQGMFVPEFDKVLFEGNLKDGQVYPELVETQYGWHIIKKVEERTEKKTTETGEEKDVKEVHSAHILVAKTNVNAIPEFAYKATGLTGKNLKSADVVFANQGMSEPQVSLKFDKEGSDLFAQITKRNIGKTVAIYLDDEIISAPKVQSEISNGEAVITGNFTLDEAKELRTRLNEGALPIPIKLVSQQSVEASLGKMSLDQSLKAGAVGLLLVAVFMMVYYGFFGFIASIALLIYAGMAVTIFKFSGVISAWPITLSLSGIAGFILSIGMAVDANVLIFERIKEELGKGKKLQDAIDEGFIRAWSSIRDGNYSTLITSFILIWLGTGFVKGFAIILVIGILLSMFTAIVLVKILVKSLTFDWMENNLGFVCGFSKKHKEENK